MNKKVEPTFESIFSEFQKRAAAAAFPSGLIATQITLTGKLEFRPLYVKAEDRIVEVAPYEYNNANFYIDADTDSMASVLSGAKSVASAIADGTLLINGDAAQAVMFFELMF